MQQNHDSTDDLLKNPHDRFFKRVFGEPRNAADFLQTYLPQPIAESLDFGSIEPQDGKTPAGLFSLVPSTSSGTEWPGG